MSVWKDVESLRNYAFRSAQVEIMRRRREWFEKMTESYAALWWVFNGHRPTVTEAAERVAMLREKGASPEAFTFREFFPSPNTAAQLPVPGLDACPAT